MKQLTKWLECWSRRGTKNSFSTTRPDKKLNLRNPTELDPKNNIESELKSIKYLNGFKILIFRESKPNPNQNISGIRIFLKSIYIPKNINY